ncbi:CueP family metal-binding protein [Microbacterium sp. nov. GSS16]|uniref:CueP family metal-binding protein n=1 Tax=Microbacterium sp. nov. GSS16 TaxID=3019890 RepID=UPI00230591A2|nr:CueP family metal-binding protein [Microbacterium sp. nov. GSS16]WCD92223.1 CueP family metal-binding protein [Microbacterium sp. nov. GSS16]
MRIRPIIPTVVLALAGALLLTACSPAEQAPAERGGAAATAPDGSAELEKLSRTDVRTVVDRLDRAPLDERDDAVAASIRTDRVVLSDVDGSQVELAMPDGLTYISFAPYRTQNHDCTFHAPSSCVGELRNTELQLTITDLATGETHVDEKTQTFDNGFVGAWLPRGIDAEVVIVVADSEARAVISTVNDDDPTCITTLPLAERG